MYDIGKRAVIFFIALVFIAPTSALAIPVSVNRLNGNHIEPLSVTDFIRGIYFVATSTSLASSFPYASTTAVSATTLCLTGDTCRTTWPSSAASTFGTTSISATSPLFWDTSTAVMSWAGLATTSQPSSSNLLVSNGGAGVYGVATGTLAASGLVSVTSGNSVVGSGATVSLSSIAANTVLGNSTGAAGVPTAFATSTLFNTAAAGVTGLLSGTDWSTFNSKQATISVTYPLTLTGATIGTEFGTTTANTFSLTQTFSVAPVFSTVLNGILATNGTGTVLATSTPTASRFYATSTLGASVFPYASSTAVTITGDLFAGTLTLTNDLSVANGGTGASTLTGVVLGNGTSAFTNGSAQTCTNQFLRAMSATYVATCATVSPTDVNLTAAWDFGGSSGFEIPNGASPTVDAIGEVALDTTSNYFLVGSSTNATYPLVFNAVREKTMILATSTSFNFTSATSTFNFGAPSYAELITAIACYTDAGTTTIRIGDGTNFGNYIQCGSGADTIVKTFGSNNSFTAREKHQIQISNLSGTPQQTTVIVTSGVTRD